jgi:hypothetical protein
VLGKLRLAYRLIFERDTERRLELWKGLSKWMAPKVDGTLLDLLTCHPPAGDSEFNRLIRYAREIMPAYRFTWNQLEWWEDTSFNEFLARFGEKEGFNSQRRWAVYQLLRLTAPVLGDTAECGVYQGADSYLMAMANRARGDGSLHHAFDSFEGLSFPTGQDGNYWQPGALACDLTTVQRNLQEFGDAVRYYPGWIPSRFAEVAGRGFRFVHIDVDLYEPTRDSLAFFYPRLVPGGIVICDDYMFSTCPGATRAVEEFLADKPEKMLPLADGGGFLMKNVRVGAPALQKHAA